MTEVHVCCGLGGVGKTTLAAAMALGHARAGRRTVVVTIDPARRLADALGATLGPDPTEVTDGLHAVMLDPKATFDDLVRARASDPERMLANRYYRALSERLSGVPEYMALERLLDLAEEGRWEVIVVDTPPAGDALDVFRAPGKLSRVFDPRVLWALLRPRSRLARLLGRGGAVVLGRLVGREVVEDIGEFFRLTAGLAESVRANADAVASLLRTRARTWLVLDASGPWPEAFLSEVREVGPPLAGFLLNRVAPDPGEPRLPLPAPPAGVSVERWERCLDGLLEWMASEQAARTSHQQVLDRLTPTGEVWTIPQLDAPPDTRSGLIALSERLPPAAAPHPGGRTGSP